jgi:hypothetical protein
LRRTFGSKREEVTGGRRNLHNEKLNESLIKHYAMKAYGGVDV